MQEKALPTSRLVPAFKQVVESEMDTGSAAQVCGSSLREKDSFSGQQRGRYTLIRKIGQGGYASIYLGVHHYLNTYVALKLLNRSLSKRRGREAFPNGVTHPC